MKKHLIKRSVTAALVAGGLAGVGAQPAHADSILFPFLSTQTGVFSFVTIANFGGSEFSDITGYEYTYGYKPIPVVNQRGCNHADRTEYTTPHDMLTFEVGNKVNDAGFPVLFEGGSAGTPGPGGFTSGAFQLPVANQLAFLAVEPRGHTGPETSYRIELFGWAEIIDTTANMTFAYSTHNFAVNDSNNPDFSQSDVGDWNHRISWYPTSLVTTSWHILPLGSVSTMTPGAGGGLRAALTVNMQNGTNDAFVDRDERGTSGNRIALVRCFGFLTLDNLLQAPSLAAGGGSTYLMATSFTASATDPVDPGSTYSAQQMLVHRVQTATTATGVAPRTAVNREPARAPSYRITLDTNN